MIESNTLALSIIIPVYNVQNYLVTCLESLKKQDETNFEVILVDDGSTDNSGAICDEYSEKDIRFSVIHKENEGPSIARNYGIEKARGEYISFVDSDDWVAPLYVSTIINAINNYDLLFFSHNCIYNDDSITVFTRNCIDAKSRSEAEKLILKLKQSCQKIEVFSFTVNKLFKRSIIKKNNIRFIDGLHTREDEVFTNTYCKYINSIKFISDNLYTYRITNNSLTSQFKNSSQLLLLSRSLDKSTDWVTYPELCALSKNRVLKFYFESGYIHLFPTFTLIKEILKYYRYNKGRVNFDKRYQMILNHNILFSSVLYVIQNMLVYMIHKLKK